MTYHVCLNLDSAYLKYAAVLIHSIISNAAVGSEVKGREPFCFHILADNLTPEDLEICKELELAESMAYPCTIIHHHVSESTFAGMRCWNGGYAAYLRLMMPQILDADIKRVLYLDCDMVCLKDIRPLFNLDLQGKTMGVVPDCYVPGFRQKYRALNILRSSIKLNSSADELYFNSGMLLVDMDKWRSQNITERCLHVLQRYKVGMPDQDALNIVLQGQVKFLPLNCNYLIAYALHTPWDLQNLNQNLQSKSSQLKSLTLPFIENPQIEDVMLLHFAAKPKPWHGRFSHIENGRVIYTSPEWRQAWFKYAKSTPVFGRTFSELSELNKPQPYDQDIIDAVETSALLADKRYNKLKNRLSKTKKALGILFCLQLIEFLLILVLA